MALYDRLAVAELPWKSLKVDQFASIWQAIYHFLLVVCSNQHSIPIQEK